jgi:hypothetical protein
MAVSTRKTQIFIGSERLSVNPLLMGALAPTSHTYSQSGAMINVTSTSTTPYGGRVTWGGSSVDFTARKYIQFYMATTIYGVSQVLDTIANGGIRILFYDASGNYAGWKLYGNDIPGFIGQGTDYFLQSFTGGGAESSTVWSIERTRTPDYSSGVLDWTAILGCEFHTKRASAVSNSYNLAIGAIQIADEPLLTGYTAGTPGTLLNIYTELAQTTTPSNFRCPRQVARSPYQYYGNPGQPYAIYFGITIGDGSTSTYFTESKKSLGFFVPYEDSGSYQTMGPVVQMAAGYRRDITINQAAADRVYFTDCQFGSSRGHGLIIQGSTSGVASFTRCAFTRGNWYILGHGSFVDCIWDTCEFVEINASTVLTGGIIRNVPTACDGLRVSAAPGDYSAIKCTVATNTGNDITINPTAAGTFNMSGITADQAYTVKIYNESPTLAITVIVGNGITYSATTAGGAIAIQAPSTELSLTGLIAGSQVRIYANGTQTLLDSIASSGTSYTYTTSGAPLVDYTIINPGYSAIRSTSVQLSGGATVTNAINQLIDREYSVSSGLSYSTDVSIDSWAKRIVLAKATTWRNLYSALMEFWRDQTALNNIEFPIDPDGNTTFTMRLGWEFTSGILHLSRGGHRYVSTSGAETAVWAGLQSLGSVSGQIIQYQQTEGAAPTSYGVGPVDGLIQTYGDSTHGNFDKRGFLVFKILADGYQDTEYDIVADGGVTSIVDNLYVFPIAAEVSGVASGDPGVTGLSITDHGGSPVSFDCGNGAKYYSITITDTNNNTATNILRWIIYNKSLGGTFQGKESFNWARLVQINGNSFETVRGRILGDVGATLKGVRVIRGAVIHPQFSRLQSDDGTYGLPPVTATAGVSGMTAGSRLRVYNVTTATEVVNAIQTGTAWSLAYTEGTTFTAGDSIQVRATYQSGAAANIEEQYAVISSPSGWAVVAAPVSDTVYAAYAVDGSTCTEFAWDGANLEIDVNDTDNQTVIQRIGAWYKYYITTATGIAAMFGGITWEKVNEIRINTSKVSLKVDNKKTTPLLLSGGRIYRSDGLTFIAAASNSIQLNYDPVYTVETGVSGLTPAESAQLTQAAAGADPAAIREEIDSNSVQLKEIKSNTDLIPAGL